MRLGLRRGAVIAALALAIACGPRPQPARPDRPHVLLLTVDTLRADHLGLLGAELPTTPYLDRLLAGGVVFERALAPVPRTTPALASLMTGSYPHRTTVRTLYDNLPEQQFTIGEGLRGAGYRTFAVVSNHILTADRGLGQGFDVYDAADDARDAAATTDRALGLAARLAPGPSAAASDSEPLFFWVHFIDPHVPYFPPLRLAREFDPQYQGPYRDHFGQIRGGIGDEAYPADLPKWKAVFRNDLPDEVNRHIAKLYAADVRATDAEIERLVEGLRTRLGNRWLIVFTADHGEALGEHDFFYDHGDYVDNPSLHVPLAFVMPPGHALAGSRRVAAWVSLVDIAPTLFDLLQLPAASADFEGRSLMPALRGDKLVEGSVFAESGESFFPQLVRKRRRFDVSGRFRTVIDGDWKLVWTPGAPAEEAWELYDLRRDPGERDDVFAPGHPEARRLQALLRAWMEKANTGEAGGSTPTADDLERLRSLGYLP